MHEITNFVKEVVQFQKTIFGMRLLIEDVNVQTWQKSRIIL